MLQVLEAWEKAREALPMPNALTCDDLAIRF